MSNLEDFSDSELIEELILRKKRKSIKFLKDWKNSSKNRTVSYASHPTTGGWMAILTIFYRTECETFRLIDDDKEKAKQLVADKAVRESHLVARTQHVKMEMM